MCSRNCFVQSSPLRGTRGFVPDVPGRHADTGENGRGAESQFRPREALPDLAGVSCQWGKISSGSHAGARIPGISNQFQDNDSYRNGQESEISDLTVQSFDGVTSDHNLIACSNHRYHDVNDSSRTFSTSPLPNPTRAEKHSLGPPPLIFCQDYPDTESKTAFDVVEDISETVKISEYPTKESFSDVGDRCLEFGLGSSYVSTGGVWNAHETILHINCKELLAAWLGLQCCASTLQDVHIHLRIDNTAAVAYVNKMGGLHSKDLCQLALQVWDWCLSRSLTISAEHLPGSLNQLADKESRTDSYSSEWALHT